MKIIHVAWNLSYGGAETLLVQLLNHQCDFHHLNLIVINDVVDKNLISRIDKRVKIHLIKRPLRSRNPLYLMKLSSLLLSIKSDIVHFHQDNLIEYIPTRFFKKNLCLTVHCVTMDVKSLYKYDYLFAISHSVKESIKKNSGLDAELIYNGIDTSLFNRRKKETKPSGEKWNIVQIGRLAHKHKGQHLLIQAADALIRKHHFSNFTIHLLGEGPSEPYLRKLVDELNLNDFVRFEGVQSFDYIRNNLCEFDLLTQPSLYEGFGLTAIEGMAAGIPVLVADVDGLKEIIREEQYGYSFESENVDDLANKIKKIIDIQQEGSDNLTAKAYEYVTRNFDISVTSNNYMKAYHTISGL